MKRRAFSILWITSVLIATAAGVFWVRSYWVNDRIAIDCWHEYAADSRPGRVTIARISQIYEPASSAAVAYPLAQTWQISRGWMVFSTIDRISIRTTNGSTVLRSVPLFPSLAYRPSHRIMSFTNGSGPYNMYAETFVIPYWAIVSAALVLPAIGMKSFYRRRTLCRLERGICRGCSYDLRATPDRCPECGLVPLPPAGPE